MIRMTIPCKICKKESTIKVTQLELNDYNAGEKNIQFCFPNLSSDERELIKTRTCGSCWDKMFEGCDDDM